MNNETIDPKTKAMILVHVLSQVKNPMKEIDIANKVIWLWEELGWNVQP